MTVARILEQERKTTQSGKGNSGKWILEFERQQALRPDPLTGWAGFSSGAKSETRSSSSKK